MAKSFIQTLDISSTELKSKRIANFVADAQANSEMLIRQKETELRALENELERTLDLGDDTTVSIANRVSKADPLATMKRIFNLRINIKTKRDDLAEMYKVHNELFPKEEAVSAAAPEVAE